MDGGGDIYPEPCVTVTILNAHSFRTAMEMVKDVRDGDVEMRFYPDRFVIEESAEDGCKFCKIVVKKKDLYLYRYNPFVIEGSEGPPECFSVTINTNEFAESIRCDKKQKVVFEVFCSVNSTNCAVCFSRDRGGDCMDRINGRCDFHCGTEDRVEDPFEAVYKDIESNSAITEKALGENIALFKAKRPVYVKFSLAGSGTIKMSITNGSRVTVVDLPLNGNFIHECEDSLSEATENTYEISLTYEDIFKLHKIIKLGQNNVIRFYMSLDYPLLVRTRLLNYGTFSIWYTGGAV